MHVAEFTNSPSIVIGNVNGGVIVLGNVYSTTVDHSGLYWSKVLLQFWVMT